jgi:O-antigen ligase
LNRAYFVLGTVAILLTGSRGALLVAVVALFVVPWTLTQVRRGVRVAAVVIVLGAGLASAWFVPAFAFERLSTTRSEITEGSLNNRLRIWKRGLQAVPDRPLHGYGPAGWFPAIGWNKAPHNTYLSILVEEGLIGLLLYLAILTVVLARLLRLHTFERRVGLTTLAALAVAMTPLGWDGHKASWLVLALLTGLSDVLAPGRPPAAPSRPMPTVLREPGRRVPRVTAR